MAILTIQQTIGYAKAAGFSGSSLENIVAIAMAESNLNTTIVNSIGATGILQIYLAVHPDVSSSQAMDPAFSFRYAYKLSSGGTNLCAWQSYSSRICGGAWDNRWAQYLPQVQAALAGGGGNSAPPSKGVSFPANSWFTMPINAGNDYATTYKGPGTDTPHYAVDVETPMDTPLFFLEPGTIKVADYQPWGGEVYEQPDGGKPYEEYFFHLDQIQASVGQHVSAGQQIGLSGGQTSGGSHPTSPQFSTGPHTHFGLFTKFVSTQNGVIPYGPDPNPLIDEAKGGGLLAGASSGTTPPDASGSGTTETEPVPLSDRVNALLSKFPGFEGIALALDEAERFPGIIWYNVNSTANVPQLPSWVPFADVTNKAADQTAALFDSSDYIGAATRSVLDTMWSNLWPALFRGGIVLIGLILVGGLILNAVNAGSNGALGTDINAIAKLGMVAA